MADQERRTTANPPPGSRGNHSSSEATRRRWAPSVLWLVLAAVLAALLGFYIYSTRLNFTYNNEVGREAIVEGEAIETPAD